VSALLRLCRLYYVVPFSLGYTLILYYALGGRMAGRWLEAATTTGALALVLCGAYALNDAVDLEVDRVNAPGRPVAAGRISRRAAATLAGALMASGLLLGTSGTLGFSLTLTVVTAGLVAYDLASKRLGAAKQLAVAALMVSLYPLAFAQSGGPSGPRAASLFVFPAWLFVTSFAYETLKDLRDAEGDLRAAPEPSALQRAPGRWRTIANAALLAGVPLVVAPLAFGCRAVYLAASAPAIALALAATRLPVRRAIPAVYAEITAVALAAALDVMAYGM
jgi:geranylgeranylglycerol-phosphate geranylgeranyltransferase